MERGGHSAKDGKEEAIQIGSLRRDVDPLKTVQLQQRADLTQVAGCHGWYCDAAVARNLLRAGG